jgi:hypothetical protein
MGEYNNAIIDLHSPPRIWSRDEILSKENPVPHLPGVYAWFFKQIPPGVPLDGCLTFNIMTLLYVGISPKEPPKMSAGPSRQTLRSRLRYHYRGNAERSTLRLTIWCLLAEQLGIKLWRVGSGKRMTFTIQGEEKLSTWMEDSTFVSWVVANEPWNIEDHILGTLSLPLNLQGDGKHPFHPVLTEIRRRARERARQLPILAR